MKAFIGVIGLLLVSSVATAAYDPLESPRGSLAAAKERVEEARTKKESDPAKAALMLKLACDDADTVDQMLGQAGKVNATQKKEIDGMRKEVAAIRQTFIDEMLGGGDFIVKAKEGDPYKFVYTANKLAELGAKDKRLKAALDKVGCTTEKDGAKVRAKCS